MPTRELFSVVNEIISQLETCQGLPMCSDEVPGLPGPARPADLSSSLPLIRCSGHAALLYVPSAHHTSFSQIRGPHSARSPSLTLCRSGLSSGLFLKTGQGSSQSTHGPDFTLVTAVPPKKTRVGPRETLTSCLSPCPQSSGWHMGWAARICSMRTATRYVLQKDKDTTHI